jgi:putative redox protein
MRQTLTVRLEQEGPSTAAARVRSHTVLVDRPMEKGGADRGPLGGEYVLVGLGGCFLSNLLAAFRSRDVAVSGANVNVHATVDGPPDRFTTFTLTVAVPHDDPDLVRKLIGIAARSCLVTNTIRRSASVSIEFDGQPVSYD